MRPSIEEQLRHYGDDLRVTEQVRAAGAGTAAGDRPGRGIRRSRIVLVAACVVFAVGAVAVVLARPVGDTAPTDTVPSPPNSVTTSSTVTTTSTPSVTVTTVPRPQVSPAPDGTDALADDTYFGYIRSIDLGARTLEFDVAQHFSLPEATAAALEDGAVEPGDTPPNDYYVRNASPVVRLLPIADDVVVTMQDCGGGLGCGESRASTLDALAAAVGSQADGEFRRQYSRYWVTVQGGVVTRIDDWWSP